MKDDRCPDAGVETQILTSITILCNRVFDVPDFDKIRHLNTGAPTVPVSQYLGKTNLYAATTYRQKKSKAGG